MNLETAREINGRLCNAYFTMHGLHDKPFPDLSNVTLADALQAGRIVRAAPPVRDGAGRRYECHVDESAIPKVLATVIAQTAPDQVAVSTHPTTELPFEATFIRPDGSRRVEPVPAPTIGPAIEAALRLAKDDDQGLLVGREGGDGSYVEDLRLRRGRYPDAWRERSPSAAS